jgi:hypothetical protein
MSEHVSRPAKGLPLDDSSQQLKAAKSSLLALHIFLSFSIYISCIAAREERTKDDHWVQSNHVLASPPKERRALRWAGCHATYCALPTGDATTCNSGYYSELGKHKHDKTLTKSDYRRTTTQLQSAICSGARPELPMIEHLNGTPVLNHSKLLFTGCVPNKNKVMYQQP